MAMVVTPGIKGDYNKDTNKSGLNTNYNQSITVSTNVTYPDEKNATVTITLTSNFVKNYWVMSHGVVFETSCNGTSKGPTSLMGNGRGTYVYAASDFSGITETAIQPFVQSHTYTVSRGESDKEIDWSVTVWGSYDDVKGTSTASDSGKLTIKSGHTHSAPTGGTAGSGTVTQNSIEVKWGSAPTNWGCSSAAKWWFKYKKSTDSSYGSWIQGDTSNVYNLTGLSPNTNYNIVLSFENAHEQWNETSAITVKTHGNTPSVSISNNNKLNNQNSVSASINSITVSASNSASDTGTLTWTYQIKKSGGSYGTAQSSASFTGLDAGTTYVVKATATNPEGYSHYAEITIRTRYATPSVSISNNNKLNNQNGVSASINSITVSASNSTSNTGTITTTYAIKKSSDTNYGTAQSSATFSNLVPGTSYIVIVTMTNPDGDSATGTITIRTRYATPSVTASNGNMYNSKSGVSASSDSITVSASNGTENTGTITWNYQIKKSSDSSYGNYGINNTFSGLSSGTTYVVQVKGTNPDGDYHTATITIRTKYTQSNFTTDIVTTDIGLEHIDFTATVKHGSTNAILSGTWSIGSVLTNQTLAISSAIGTGKTGYVLAAATSYKIAVVVTLTSTYDDITCTFDKSFTTDAKSSFADTLGNFEFCYPTEVAANYKITNPSGNAVRCSLVVGGTTILTRDKSSSWDNSVDLQLTDDELDAIYKKLGNNNFVAYTFTVGTYSNKNQNYITYTTDSTGTITLTGKMKTTHVGLEDGTVERAQALVGVNNDIKLAVVWVGDKDGKPMRVI